jgi:hypothetical protein
MIQTWALLLDAYRDLNSRRMFWIVLIISGLVAGSMASIGLSVNGFTIFGLNFPTEIINARQMSPGTFYKLIFVQLGIQWWLTLFATCLALISTASIFPDFIAGGAIDLYLSKPISRWRLFLTKYACGLLFVALQIACFSLAGFLAIGIRGGDWEPRIFLAIPLVVAFYSYLYCICVFIGVTTRSTVAAILLTLLSWFVLFGVHTADFTLLLFKTHDERSETNLIAQIDREHAALAAYPTTSTSEPTFRQRLLENQLKADVKAQDEYHPKWYSRFYTVVSFITEVLPKTNETVDLLQRNLIRRSDLPGQTRRDEDDDSGSMNSNGMFNRGDVRAAQKEIRGRTWVWITGTSLGFEAVVLLVTGWTFCRRDY